MNASHSTRRFGRVTPARLIATIAGTAVAANCMAIDVNWINPAGGNTSTLANWSPQHIPSGNDFAHFNVAGTYSVLWDAATPASLNRISVEGGANLTLTVSNPLRAVSDFSVNNGTGSSTCSLTGGTITAGSFSVAPSTHATFTGTMSITGPTARVVMDDDFDACSIGAGGGGTLNINNGGSLHSDAQVIIGGSPSSGVVVVTGVASPSLTRSTLSTGGGVGLMNLKVGIASPSSSLAISNGALVSISDGVYVSTNATTPSVVSVGGTALGFDATMSTSLDLYVGNDGGGSPVGKGTVILNAGGAINVARDTLVGGLTASRGTLNINGGTLTTHNLEVKPGLAGTFNHVAGTVIVDGGTYKANTSGAGLAVGGTDPAGGTFTLQNGAQWTLPAAGSSASPVTISSAGAGSTLNLLSGSDFFHTGSQVRVGNSGQRGTMNISGGSTMTTSGPINMGGTGSSVALSGGSTLTCAFMNIGGNTGDSTSFSLTGAGTTLNTPGLIRVGHNLTGGGGVCEVSITDGAVLNSTFVDPAAASLSFRKVTGAGGSLTMNNGTINAADEIEYSNQVTPLIMTNSTINAPLLSLVGSDLIASGTINAEVISVSGVTDITATGPLTLGREDFTGVVGSMGMTFNVGPHPVTIRAQEASHIGQNVLFAGGSVTAASGLVTYSSTTLSGTGTIEADITHAGTILCTGPGLTLLGNLSDNGVLVSGTRLTFGNGGSYTGDGILDCEIAALAGSTFTPSGFITMGKLSSPVGVKFDGVMNITNTTIECFDSNGARIGGTVNLNNGELTGLSGLRFEGVPLPLLNGTGRVNDDCFMNGRIQPGIASGDSTGHLDFVNLSFGITGSLVIDIEGDAPGTFDTIASADDLDLNNATLIVNRVNDYYPSRGTVYRIATGSLFGSQFGLLIASGFHVEYGVGFVDLVFDGLCDSIDFNNDEAAFDPTDIEAFLSVFSEGPCIPEFATCNDLDFNNDGALFDPCDIESFLVVFSEGPCTICGQ